MTARELVAARGVGVLLTLSNKISGYPFGSLMPYAVDADGRAILLMSALAEHTRNLKEDPRAALFVADGDSPESPRTNLMGKVSRVPSGEIAAVRALYLARHPEAVGWVDFQDFGFYRLDGRDIYMVGGFGVMGWETNAT